jgi:N-methylhydantoinase A
VTDADVILGRIDPAGFAGGKLNLFPELAETAVVGDVAGALGMAVEEGARGIAEIVDETMASAARVHAVENGKDTAGRTLIAFGGAAPLHAARLAQKLGIRRVVIPVDAGVGSAHGFLDAPIAYEVVRTNLMRLDGLDTATVETLFAEMREEAEAVVRLGYREGELAEHRVAFMRYRGQGHEIAVSLDDRVDPVTLRAAFEETYAQLFGRIIPKLEVEAVTWTLALSQPYALPAANPPPPFSTEAEPVGERWMIESASGDTVRAPVFERAALTVGARITGPAALMEAGTTTIVPTGFTAIVAVGGEIVMEGGAA